MRRPNILLIHTDQQRWDALGANGNFEIKTPNLDQLAKNGVNFDHYFVQNPVCMPSRISYLSGQYPSQLKITHMAVPVPETVVTLPRMLKNYGYITANIGKLHFLPHANRDHTAVHPDYGFDHLEISDEPGCYEDAYRAWVRRKDPSQLDYISVGLPPCAQTWQETMEIQDGIRHPEERFPKREIPFPGKSEFTHSAFVAEQTIEFIQQHSDETFLCIAGFYSPHDPWVVPQKFLDLYPDELTIPKYPSEVEEHRTDGRFSDAELQAARRGYYAMVSEVDYHVGRILTTLDRLGISDNTIVVFTSDHGDWLGEHLKYGKGFPGPDCVSRVPFIVRWPEGIKYPGRTVTGIAEAVDLVPTILECAGIPIPSHLQGCSLADVLKSNTTATNKDSAIMEGNGWKSLRTQRYRYVARSNGDELLYDLETDPGEYYNVADDASYRDALAECRKIMVRRVLEMERPLPRTWPY